MLEKNVVTLLLMVVTIVAIIAVLRVKTDNITDPEIIKENSKKTKFRLLSAILLICYIILPPIVENKIGFNYNTYKLITKLGLIIRYAIFIINIALLFILNLKKKMKHIIILIILYCLCNVYINLMTFPRDII